MLKYSKALLIDHQIEKYLTHLDYNESQLNVSNINENSFEFGNTY
jgi:hypothetical protein